MKWKRRTDAPGGGRVSGDGVGMRGSTARREGGRVVEKRKVSKMAGSGGK